MGLNTNVGYVRNSTLNRATGARSRILRSDVSRDAKRGWGWCVVAINKEVVWPLEMAQKEESKQGLDSNHRVKGRKRHIAVDGQGLALNVCIGAANVADSTSAPCALFLML